MGSGIKFLDNFSDKVESVGDFGDQLGDSTEDLFGGLGKASRALDFFGIERNEVRSDYYRSQSSRDRSHIGALHDDVDLDRAKREYDAYYRGMRDSREQLNGGAYYGDSRGRVSHEPYYSSRDYNGRGESTTFTANGATNPAAATTDEQSLRQLLQFISQPVQTAEDNQRFQQAAAYYVSLGAQYNPAQLVSLMNEYPLNDALKSELTRGIYAQAQSRGYEAPARGSEATGNPRDIVPGTYRNVPTSQNLPDSTPVDMASIRDTYLNSLLERNGYNTYGRSEHDGMVATHFDAKAQAALHDWQKDHGFAEGKLTKEQLKQMESYAAANADQFNVAMAEEKAAPATPNAKERGGRAQG